MSGRNALVKRNVRHNIDNQFSKTNFPSTKTSKSNSSFMKNEYGQQAGTASHHFYMTKQNIKNHTPNSVQKNKSSSNLFLSMEKSNCFKVETFSSSNAYG